MDNIMLNILSKVNSDNGVHSQRKLDLIVNILMYLQIHAWAINQPWGF